MVFARSVVWVANLLPILVLWLVYWLFGCFGVWFIIYFVGLISNLVLGRWIGYGLTLGFAWLVIGLNDSGVGLKRVCVVWVALFGIRFWFCLWMLSVCWSCLIPLEVGASLGVISWDCVGGFDLFRGWCLSLVVGFCGCWVGWGATCL